MELELIVWPRPAPTDAKKWPCTFCGALATHRRTMRQHPITLKLVTCLTCGKAPDAVLWELLQDRKPCD